MTHERSVDVAIIGAGTAGSHAMSQARRAGKSFVLVNGGPMGTTCARVGCMPSKMMIQAAELLHDRHILDELGIRGGQGLRADIPAVLGRVRALRDDLVEGAIRGMTRSLAADQLIDGYARLVAPDTIEVAGQRIRAGRIVLATGSRPVVPRPWQALGDRVLTTDTLFEQEDLPRRMAVIGLGAIGLEMGQALARLGIEVTGFDALDRIGGIADPVIAGVALELLGQDFPMHLGQEAKIEQLPEGLRVSAGAHSVVVDKVLVSMGRRPNVDELGLADVGAPLDERGRPKIDPHTMQLGDLPIFVAGDATGDALMMHVAADEGRVAGFNAGRDGHARFQAKASLGIVFTDPNIVSVGARLPDLEHDLGQGATAIGEYDFASQGRARIMARARGRLRLYAERASGRLLGASMCAPGGEHLGHLLAWSIQQKLTVFELQQMPYYHPTLEEGLAAAVDALARNVEARPASALPHVPAAER
ncbi:MAG TPA: dihydrolipoyl dehydrogenase [Haliangium sp.]|nr:dihydrolipoyl dehydrogenase [Haliangium sp.]